MNRSPNHNHWIILKLVGVKSNRDGLGTKVKITTSLGTVPTRRPSRLATTLRATSAYWPL